MRFDFTKFGFIQKYMKPRSSFGKACALMLAFGCALVKHKEAIMGTADLYENYQSWCRDHHLQPFTSKQFNQIAKTELEITLGLKYRHDLPGDPGGTMRGWKGLGLIETDKSSDGKNASVASGEQMALAG